MNDTTQTSAVQKKILLVDDNELVKRVYHDSLVKSGYTVETASDGEEGLMKMKSFMPQVLLLDIFMPKMSGFDMLEQVKKDPSLAGIPVIAFSDIRVDREDLIKRGVQHFFLKSESQPEDIKNTIEQILVS